jgi:predicted nucleic acid-binding protein
VGGRLRASFRSPKRRGWTRSWLLVELGRRGSTFVILDRRGLARLGRPRRVKCWGGYARMSADVWYVDTSALVKTVVEEPESRALLRWLADKDRLVACELVRVETVRAVRISDPTAVPRAREVAASVTLIRLDDPLYDLAADLEPASLRSLDAVHLAAALSVGNELAGVVTYDARMEAAALDLSLHVESPGRSARAQRNS